MISTHMIHGGTSFSFDLYARPFWLHRVVKCWGRKGPEFLTNNFQKWFDIGWDGLQPKALVPWCSQWTKFSWSEERFVMGIVWICLYSGRGVISTISNISGYSLSIDVVELNYHGCMDIKSRLGLFLKNPSSCLYPLLETRYCIQYGVGEGNARRSCSYCWSIGSSVRASQRKRWDLTLYGLRDRVSVTLGGDRLFKARTSWSWSWTYWSWAPTTSIRTRSESNPLICVATKLNS